MVELKEPFATLWRGKDPFEEVKTLQGKVFSELESRHDPERDNQKFTLIADASIRR